MRQNVGLILARFPDILRSAFLLILFHRLAQIMDHDVLGTTKLYIKGNKHDLQREVEIIAWT